MSMLSNVRTHHTHHMESEHVNAASLQRLVLPTLQDRFPVPALVYGWPPIEEDYAFVARASGLWFPIAS